MTDAENTELIRRAIELQTELDTFKRRVRAKAIEVAEEENWCTEGLNAALESLGLDRHYTHVRVDVSILVKGDEDYARDQVRKALTQFYDYDIESIEPKIL